MNKMNFFLVTLSLLIAIVSINIIGVSTPIREFLIAINASFFEPTLVWSTSLFISSVILLSQSHILFQSWFKKFFIWYFPVAYGATFLFSPYGGITSTGRYEAAILFGVGMVLVTVVWSAVAYLKK